MAAVGDVLPELSRRVEQSDIDAYADASGDRNPIHLDPDYASKLGLPGTIAHGMLEMGILAAAVSRWAGPRGRLTSLACRFSKPLVAGDTITCSGRVVAVDGATVRLEVEAISDRGDRVLSHATATVEPQDETPDGG